jgi:hypothetical protein
MAPVEFFDFTVREWLLLLVSIAACMTLAGLLARRIAIAPYLDPIHLVLTFVIGVKYGILVALYVAGYVEFDLFALFVAYAIALYAGCGFGLRMRPWRWSGWNRYFGQKLASGSFVYAAAFVFCATLVAYLYFTGGGLFAQTNRFEESRGYGYLVRAFNTTGYFVIGYFAIQAALAWRKGNGSVVNWTIIVMIFAAMYVVGDGAKASALYLLLVISVAFRLRGIRKLLPVSATIGIGVFAVLVACAGLYINLLANGENPWGDDERFPGVPYVVGSALSRVLSNGDQIYLGLPNGVIDQIETDSLGVRVAAQIVGNSTLSAMLGYNTADYSVGRQLLLFHSPSYEIAGGPTSGFDLFYYVYLGPIGGLVASLVMGYFLGAGSKLLKSREWSTFGSALLATLWTRVVLVLLEPPMGIAFFVDIAVFFALYRVAFYSAASPRRSAVRG